jgi:uncharacterized protein (TIGR02596 family)
MKPSLTSNVCRERVGAFTLIELLVVISIIMLLSVMILPAVGPLMRSSKMNNAAAMITSSLDLARQTALTQNRDVELRFYRYAPKTAANNKQFRAFRTFFVTGDGSDPTKAKALSKINYLPDTVIISSSTKFSPLLDYATNSSCLTQGTENLNGSADATEYVSFRFRATGGTNLSPVTGTAANWFITLYIENAPVATNGIPANYFTAQIDPVTGRVRNYRP